MTMANDLDFFITFSSRASGLGWSCACCWNVLESRVPSPVWIFIDRAGSRPICMACAARFCPLLIEVLRSWYGRLDGPRPRPGTAQAAPPRLESMREFRAIACCDVVTEFAQAIEPVEMLAMEPPAPPAKE
jgi:hypothetical protein